MRDHWNVHKREPVARNTAYTIQTLRNKLGRPTDLCKTILEPKHDHLNDRLLF